MCVGQSQVSQHALLWTIFKWWQRGLVVVAPERPHVAIILHMRRKEGWLSLLQDIQWGHLRGGQAIALYIRTHGVQLPELSECWRLWVPRRTTPEVVAQAEGFTTRLRQVVQKDVWLNTLHLLGLLLPPGSVFVVGVVLKMLYPQSLSFLHEWALVNGAQCFPRLTQHLAEHCVVQVRVLLGQSLPLVLCPDHEGIHRAANAGVPRG